MDDSFHPLVSRLAEALRPRWDDLPERAPLAIAPDLEEVRGELEGEAMLIRNQLLRCRGLRKIHLETARVGRHLDILHCVMFPDPRFDLPLFGVDIVAGRGVVSAAIVDLSPTDGELPASITADLEAQPRFNYRQPRDLPGWGDIFSPQVLFVRPADAGEEDAFIADVLGFHDVLMRALVRCEPEPASAPASRRRLEGQRRYCRQQRSNDKTRRVLEMAFNPDWADRYISTLLFDDPTEPSP